MIRLRSLPSSPAAGISLLAILVTLGGSAYAATQIDGASFKQRSIDHTKVKKDTLTGAEVNEAKLGVVPKAVSAATAGNALLLGGKLTSAFLPAAKLVMVNGVRMNDGDPPKDFALGSVFTIRVVCTHNTVDTTDKILRVLIKSTQANSVSQSPTGGPISVGTSFVPTLEDDANTDNTFFSVHSVTASAPDGSAVNGRASAVVRNTSLGVDCAFAGFVLIS